MTGKSGRKNPNQRKISDYSSPASATTNMAASGRVQEGTQPEPSVSIADVMGELRRMGADLAGKIDPLIAKQALTQQHTEALAEKLREAEERIAALEQQVQPLLAENRKSMAKIRELEARAEDQESRGRRNNVRIIGLPEGTEPPDAAPYIETLIRTALPAAKLSPTFIIERAHRALQKKPPPGAPPRAVLFRCLNYRDRDAILAAARVQGVVQHDGANLQLYPDFTLAIQRARKDFMDTKKILRQKKVIYAMIFPARLKIIQDGRSHFFTCPTAAKQFAMELRAPLLPERTPPREPRTSQAQVEEPPDEP